MWVGNGMNGDNKVEIPLRFCMRRAWEDLNVYITVFPMSKHGKPHNEEGEERRRSVEFWKGKFNQVQERHLGGVYNG